MNTSVNEAPYSSPYSPPLQDPFGQPGSDQSPYGSEPGLTDSDALLGQGELRFGNSLPGTIPENLSQNFSRQLEVLKAEFNPAAVDSAVGQLFKETLAEKVMVFVDEMGLSTVETDAILDNIDTEVKTNGTNSGSDVAQAVQARLGDEIDIVTQIIVDSWRDQMMDESRRSFSGSGVSGGGGRPGGGAPGSGGGVGTMGGGGDAAGAEGMGVDPFGAEGMGAESTGIDPLRAEGMGAESLGQDPIGVTEVSSDPMAAESAATAASSGSEAESDASVEPDAQDTTEGASAAADSGQAEGSSAASESGGAGGTSGGATNNWLVVLASILGKASGKHLKAMVDLGEQMGSIDSKANPEQFAQLNAEFQAEAQIFKLFQEAISTMLKSIGEGMQSVARKT